MKRLCRTISLFGLLALLLPAGCAKPAVTVLAPTETPVLLETALPVIAVEAAVATPVPTEPPTPSPTPAPTDTPEPTPTPVPFSAAAIPAGLRTTGGFMREGSFNLLYCAAQNRYVAYGRIGDGECGFFPSDAAGNVAPGAQPVEQLCMVPVYTPYDPPTADGEWLLVIYLPSQCVVAFCSDGGEWREQRSMICSTGRRNHETPVGQYKIYQRYEYKLLGTEESPCYGLWACRFKDHYLFHSVPISADAGRDAEKGHRLTNMKKYEKLGTVASDGCVRLTVADAKWIYELSADRTVAVRVVNEAGPTPTKPPAIRWEAPYTDKSGYGWDPTDPHPDNPYHLFSDENTGF